MKQISIAFQSVQVNLFLVCDVAVYLQEDSYKHVVTVVIQGTVIGDGNLETN